MSVVSHVTDTAARLKILCEYGSQVEVDYSLPTKLYYRSGRELIRMATVYLDESELESAFILYSKYITLFVERLPSHPDYKSVPPAELAEVKKKMRTVFPLAEEIKSKLKKRYEQEEKIRKQEEAKRQAEIEAQNARRRAEEEERLKERLAEEERLRHESEEKWCREQEERYRELQLQEQQRLQDEKERGITSVGLNTDKGTSSSGLNNERISAPSGIVDLTQNDLNDFIPQAKPRTLTPLVPDRDLKTKLTISEPSIPSAPTVDRNNKPSYDHFTSIGSFGRSSSSALRQVIIPTDIFAKFLLKAQSNTHKNTETLGILFGKLSKNSFTISDVFIPKQHGTPDSCDMENEMDLIDFQDKCNLITLGWIHTHPTQTAFLSSVDMHTHFPYQKMMPESVAIVCSPKFKESGVFRLTKNGLNEIGSCTQKGFHYHQKEPPLFEEGENIQMVNEISIHIEDARS